MRADDLPEVRGLPLFEGISEDAFASIARAAYVQNFPPQVELIREGDKADFLHVVVSGTVELFSEWEGHDTTLSLAGPRTTFILAATVKDRPYLMSARTLERTRLVLLPSEDVRAVFEIDDGFARAVVTELATAFRGAIRALKNQKMRNSVERLAAWLLAERTRLGDSFELRLEKRRLASWLGMQPENLSRTFAQLRDHGVEVNGALVTLADPAALQRLARPTPMMDDLAS